VRLAPFVECDEMREPLLGGLQSLGRNSLLQLLDSIKIGSGRAFGFDQRPAARGAGFAVRA
jgi:hypothetical protein